MGLASGRPRMSLETTSRDGVGELTDDWGPLPSPRAPSWVMSHDPT